MNTKLLSTLSIAATTGTAMLLMSAPAKAASFGTGGISFAQDTEITFLFNQTKGAAISALKIFEVNDNQVGAAVATLFEKVKSADAATENEAYNTGYLGTLGNTVLNGQATFTFLANKVYTLGLMGTLYGGAMDTVYSTSSLNAEGIQYTVFGSQGGAEKQDYQATAAGFQSGNPFAGPLAISFEDQSKKMKGDFDYNDFQVTAVPEPLTLGGLALGAAGMAIARRRNRKTA